MERGATKPLRPAEAEANIELRIDESNGESTRGDPARNDDAQSAKFRTEHAGSKDEGEASSREQDKAAFADLAKATRQSRDARLTRSALNMPQDDQTSYFQNKSLNHSDPDPNSPEHPPSEHNHAGREESGSQDYQEEAESANLEEFELIISRVIDLVSCRDHRNLSSFLGTVLLDLTKVYDERGYTLVHICCMNSDAKTLDVLINQQFKFWETSRRVTKQETLELLHDWVNQESLPPERNFMFHSEVSRDLVDDRG